MVRSYCSLTKPLFGSLGPIMLASTLWLAGCAPNGAVAGNKPSICGGDFGMVEQMEYELRGNPLPASREEYDAC